MAELAKKEAELEAEAEKQEKELAELDKKDREAADKAKQQEELVAQKKEVDEIAAAEAVVSSDEAVESPVEEIVSSDAEEHPGPAPVVEEPITPDVQQTQSSPMEEVKSEEEAE